MAIPSIESVPETKTYEYLPPIAFIDVGVYEALSAIEVKGLLLS